jgi:hypothetical protein
MKVVKFLVEGLYWLNIVFVPIFLLGGVGYLLYHYYATTLTLAACILLLVTGITLGIYWAEKVRKTIGCSVFVNRIFSSRDIG